MQTKTTTVTLLLTAVMFLVFCGSSSKEAANETSTEQVETVMYQCPMKCEGEKMYEEPGTCPVCKMDLELLTEVEHKHHNH